ncbi:MAG: hypothetical protein HFJ11_03220 [Bacilli bacterium]|nr:hypothetical protein [Bacilli bacterium]
MFDIQDIRKKVLIKYPPFGSFLANLPFIEDYTCMYKGKPTAATDGNAIHFHPDFINSLNEKQQIAIFAHEISHVVLKHLERRTGKDPELWNIACDASINGNLKKDGLELVEGMIERDDALLFSEEELYEIIKDEEKNNNNKKRSQPHVSHDSWDNNQNNSSKTDSSKTIDANSFFEKARQDRIENLKKLKENLVKQALETNPNKDYKNNSINNIDGATRLVDWRRLLENNCRIDKDWTYQNATIEYGVLTPHMEDLPRPTIEILLDTSGSINTQLLRNFLKECLGILTYSKIKVGCFDDDFYGFQEVRNKNDIENFPLKGGGGTNFDIAVKAFSKDADNKIIFTDGLADMPNVSAKIIWVVFGKDKINPLGGKVIYINENQYEDLNKNTSVIRR